MKIYVVGSSKNNFLPLDNIREKFLIDQKHEGDNIDFLNPWYCELTGLYHLWKNCDDDIVGLEHYRRYFGANKKRLINEREINDKLQNTECLVHTITLNNNLLNQYLSAAPKTAKTDIFHLMTKMDKNFQKVFKDYLFSNTLIKCNMFICKKHIIDEYCDFFFKAINDMKLTDTNKRMIGYLSEFTFGAWLIYRKAKIEATYEINL